MLPVDLRQSILDPSCAKNLHHMCQRTHEYNNEIKSSELKMTCKDCISQLLPTLGSDSESQPLTEYTLDQHYSKESSAVDMTLNISSDDNISSISCTSMNTDKDNSKILYQKYGNYIDNSQGLLSSDSYSS